MYITKIKPKRRQLKNALRSGMWVDYISVSARFLLLDCAKRKHWLFWRRWVNCKGSRLLPEGKRTVICGLSAARRTDNLRYPSAMIVPNPKSSLYLNNDDTASWWKFTHPTCCCTTHSRNTRPTRWRLASRPSNEDHLSARRSQALFNETKFQEHTWATAGLLSI